MRSSFLSASVPLMPISTSSIDGGLRRRANGHANGDAARPRVNGTAAPADKTGGAPNATAAAATPIDWEIPRKVLHSSIGFFTLWLWKDGSAERVVVALTAGLAVVAPVDVVRLNVPGVARVYERLLGFLMRESEKTHSNGVIWYLVGAIAVLHFLPLDIATVSILILSWADTAASTCGRLWGRYTPPLPQRLPFLRLPLAPRKSLAGFIAASVTGALVAIGFWRFVAPIRLAAPGDISWSFNGGFNLTTNDAMGAVIQDAGVTGIKAGGWLGLGLIGLTAGVVSGVAEALDVGTWDDNLTLPVISGACLWAFFKLMSYIS